MDALLGCPLCLPDDDVLNPDVFDSLAQPVKDAVCRSLFHAVNWLIEVISTFVNAKPMRSKVIKRIRDVILLKDKVTTFTKLITCLILFNWFLVLVAVLLLLGPKPGVSICCSRQCSSLAEPAPSTCPEFDGPRPGLYRARYQSASSVR